MLTLVPPLAPSQPRMCGVADILSRDGWVHTLYISRATPEQVATWVRIIEDAVSAHYGKAYVQTTPQTQLSHNPHILHEIFTPHGAYVQTIGTIKVIYK